MAETKTDLGTTLKTLACSDLSRLAVPALTGTVGAILGSSLGPAGTIGGGALGASAGNAAQQEFCDGSIVGSQVVVAGVMGSMGGSAAVIIKTSQAALAGATVAAPILFTSAEKLAKVESFIERAPTANRELLRSTWNFAQEAVKRGQYPNLIKALESMDENAGKAMEAMKVADHCIGPNHPAYSLQQESSAAYTLWRRLVE